MKTSWFSIIGKKIQTHFTEFVMLFLAVFLGFLADNFRDTLTERSLEKEYVQSLLEDIEIDKIKIRETMDFNTYRITRLDTLSNLCFTYEQHHDDEALYTFYDGLNGDPVFFIPNEQTLTQLHHSNGLRLLSSKTVVKAILQYEYRKQELKRQQADYEYVYRQSTRMGLHLFNQRPFKEKEVYRKRTGQIYDEPIRDSLLSNEILLITEFANTLYLYQGNVRYYNVMLEDAWASADALTQQLKKAYALN